MTIKEYTVILSPSLSALCMDVSIKISRGWEPTGGVAIDAEDCFYQAIVKREAREAESGEGTANG